MFRIVDAPSLPAYDLGPEHPFARDRQLPLFDLLERHGLIDAGERLAPEAASRHVLEYAHSSDYIEVVAGLSAPTPDPELLRRAPLYGMGTADNPIAEHQHDGAAAAAGGTLACVRAVVGGDARHAFNPAGGLHHAMPAAASGFCIYNDLVIGIREARNLGVERIAYVDFDVHHGDGVEHAFRDDPHVLTVSFHEDPAVRWPYTGKVTDRGGASAPGSVVNLPFASGTIDESWQHVVEAVLRESLDRFAPDLLVTQHGCDPHHEDPLADLDLTTASFDFAARLSRELAEQHCNGLWVATGGGGYQPYRVIPRAWSLVWARLTGRTLPEVVDRAWRDTWQEHAATPLAERFIDEAYSTPRAGAAARSNEATLTSWRNARP